MGLGVLGEMQLRSKGAKGQLHTSFLPLYHLPKLTLGLAAFDDDTVDSLQTTELSIWWYKIGPKEEECKVYKIACYLFEPTLYRQMLSAVL